MLGALDETGELEVELVSGEELYLCLIELLSLLFLAVVIAFNFLHRCFSSEVIIFDDVPLLMADDEPAADW